MVSNLLYHYYILSFEFDMILQAAVAVSALVLTKESSIIMDKLEACGATDILLISISNSRM